MDEPLIAIENIVVKKNNIFRMGEKKDTIKIILPNGVELIKFKSSDDEYQLLYSDLGCVIINVVGRCSINTWAGETTAQILIEDIEIVKREKYYF